MRYKKGSKVEVLNTKEMRSGSWRTAQVISGNGHTYYVRYDNYLSDGSSVVERVPRKAIRPCPPEVKRFSNWAPGDFVEVLDDGSWKIALVCRVLDEDCYLVRLLKSSKLLRAHKSDLRVRQTWQDDQWIAIQTDGGIYDHSSLSKGGKSSHRFPKSCLEVDNSLGENHIANDEAIEKPTGVISRKCSRKRPLDACQPADRCAGAPRKKRLLEKTMKQMQIADMHMMDMPGKVDAVASPRILLVERNMHSSINNKTPRCSALEMGRGLSEVNHQYCLIRNPEPSYAESTSSSVGSCSVSNSPYRSTHQHITYPSADIPSHSDDAESSCPSRREASLIDIQYFEAETRQLELQAYRKTLMALFASGPISWEQEALLTNLRIKGRSKMLVKHASVGCHDDGVVSCFSLQQCGNNLI